MGLRSAQNRLDLSSNFTVITKTRSLCEDDILSRQVCRPIIAIF